MTSTGLLFSGLRKLHESHRQYDTSIFIFFAGWVVLPVMSKLILSEWVTTTWRDTSGLWTYIKACLWPTIDHLYTTKQGFWDWIEQRWVEETGRERLQEMEEESRIPWYLSHSKNSHTGAEIWIVLLKALWEQKAERKREQKRHVFFFDVKVEQEGWVELAAATCIRYTTVYELCLVQNMRPINF